MSIPSVPAGADCEAMRTSAEAMFAKGDLAGARRELDGALAIALAGGQRASVLSDLSVLAVHEGRLADAARLADEALGHDLGHQAAIEVLDHCFSVRENEVEARMAPLREARAREFALLSTNVRVSGQPILAQATQLNGRGRICFGENVQLGYATSPGFLSGYGYIEARHRGTTIDIGAGTMINNSAVIVAEGDGISIGRACLCGVGVEITDTDGHDLHPARRHGGVPATAPVVLGDNVFLGNGVRVMKGVTIGRDTVVGAGSLVTRSLPAGVIAAGAPARPLRDL